MADTELHGTDSEAQKDWQTETATTDKDTTSNAENSTDAKDAKEGEVPTKDTKNDATVAQSDADGDDYGVSMDKVEAVLNATADKSDMTPQMRRMMQRQAENTKRVEESIKGTKSNPRWFVPLFCALMIIGLIWAVVYYLSPSSDKNIASGGSWPIPGIGPWNLAIAFAILMTGFIMTMWWR